ncbi:MAG TPA: hypothetical protein VG963_13145 [Polyangiaceae bacterium]|nr:hypothetical protein [Polyangiaceae bacterium]
MSPGRVLTLGSVTNGVAENLSGKLDDVIVHNRALSPAEVAELAHQ